MISDNVVVAVVVFILSLLLEVIPGFIELWDKVPGRWKPLVFLGMSLAIAFGFPYLACYGITLGATATCPVAFDGAYINSQLMIAFVAFGVVQSTFSRIQDPLGKRVVVATRRADVQKPKG